MTYTPEQITAGTYCWEVLRPRADVLRAEVEGLAWWRFWARRRALRRWRATMDEWQERLRGAGIIP